MNDTQPDLVDSVPEETTETPSEPESENTEPVEGETTETPAEETPTEEPTEEPQEPLYDLPDGRKVDAQTLQKEWKENFLPDYTRKSQKLSEIERATNPNINNQTDEPEWKRPDYIPKSYAEIIEIAEQRALERIDQQKQEEQQQLAQVSQEVDAQVSEIKKQEPNLDENALFMHATKYGFKDLNTAYANMKDMKKAVVTTEQKVIKNIKSRGADPVSGSPSASNSDTGVDPSTTSNFGSALEYLRSLNK